MADLGTDKKRVLIIGAGIAGLTAAVDLSQLGNEVLVVEKGLFVGGHGVRLACKATDHCLKCNDCLVEDKLKEVFSSPSIQLKTNTVVTNIEKKEGLFHASLISLSSCVDPAKCNNCGLCADKCMEVGTSAIAIAPSPNIVPSFAVDLKKCQCTDNGNGFPCESVCPQDAIKIEKGEQSWSFDAHGIIVASGFEPYDPAENMRYGVGRIENVVAASEIEELLRKKGKILCGPDGHVPERVAFVQCVGSRDHKINHDYCSRVCCGYALRMALRLAHDHKGIHITVFYMDVQNFGKDFERYYREAKDKLRLIRGLPGDFYPAEDNKVSLSFFDEHKGMTVSEDFDMVILSVGISPSEENEFFMEKLGLSKDPDGFLIPTSGAGGSVVVAGTAGGPMDVAESIGDAKRAAMEISDYLAEL